MDIDLRPQPLSQEPSRRPRRPWRWIGIAAVPIVIVGAGASWYFSQPKTDDDKIQDVVAEVGEIMLLPEGELPTVATIVDLERLAGQPFFKNAKKGDIVLIYTKEQKAILYDPVAKKIVEAALLAIDGSTL